MCPQREGHRIGAGEVGLAVGVGVGVDVDVVFGFGETLPGLRVSVRGRFRGAKPLGDERSRGLLTPASRLFAPEIRRFRPSISNAVDGSLTFSKI